MWIERDLQQRIAELMRAFPAILLTGPRQTGKTSLLRHMHPDATYLSLDLPSTAFRAEHEPVSLLSDRVEPVIIDEVQYAPGVFRYLKSVIDQQRDRMGRFLMTGSQKLALLEHASESLAGRVGIVELDTLSASELIRSGFSDRSDMLWRGAFPELYRNPILRPQDFYGSYVATYLERDVRPAVRAGSLRDFERCLRSCAIHSGRLLNYASMASDLGVALTTVKEWVSILVASNQIVLLEPWFGNLQKRMVKTPKLYLRDTGLLAFLLGFDSSKALEESPFIGALWETFVVGQILRQIQLAGSSAKLFFLRDAHGTEVDLVLEHNGRMRLMEVKWSEAFTAPPTGKIQRVAGWLGPDRLADEHWIVARPAESYLTGGPLPVRVVNGFVHRFV